MKDVNSALLDGLKAAGTNGVSKLKRKGAPEEANGQKKRRVLGALDDDDAVSSSEEEGSFESDSDNEVIMG